MRAAALAVWSTACLVGACGGATSVQEARSAAPEVGRAAGAAPGGFLRPSRLLPEPDPELLAAARETGEQQQQLIAGLRVLVRPDGTVTRADERFGPGAVYPTELPGRMGGGFVFHQSDSDGTRLWRAPSWIGPLQPLASVGMTVREVVVGLDRLYLRSEASNRLLSVDASSGALVPLGGLPVAGGYGPMVFPDGWRGLVDTDLRGPLATFDAGWSWQPVEVGEPVVGLGLEKGDPVLHVTDGRYRIDPGGHLQRIDDSSTGQDALSGSSEEGSVTGDREGESSSAAPGGGALLLGPSPLRTAVESGWPDTDHTAVVATGGSLVRVELPEGRVLGQASDAYPDRDARCVGARVGRGFGFICGEPGGATSVYELVDSLKLRAFARFDEPRFVAPSGNGSIVVRGPCAASATPSQVRTYCIVGADGREREIGIRGDLGSERVLALSDGRVVVLVPPRPGAGGRLTVIEGESLRAVDLRFAGQPNERVKLAERGLWLEGFEQRGPDRIGGWIEGGGPTVGVEIKLDGSVELGRVVDLGGPVLVSGRLGLAISEPEGAMETTDGGRHWKSIELPSLPELDRDPGTRGCTPVGCALRGWVRVGWGSSSNERDLGPAPEPKAARGMVADTYPVRLLCRVDPPHLTTAPASTSDTGVSSGSTLGSWSAFLGTPPPGLTKGEEGVAKGTSQYDPVPAHAYVWGPKGADWSRTGYWQLRFGDRFDPRSGVRVTAPSRSPWLDRDAAAREIGVHGPGGYWRWVARLDPGGQCALVSACLGTSCRLYAACDGRVILPVRDGGGATTGLPVPIPQGAVRAGESWYFLAEVGRDAVDLWRIELGVAQPIARYPRLDRRGFTGAALPALVRRSHAPDIGLLVSASADPSTGTTVSQWVVYPIDVVTGRLTEPVLLGRADLRGTLPPPCDADQDGWLAELDIESATVVDLVAGRSYLDGIEYRLRLDADGACTQAIAARATRPPAVPADERPAGSRRGVQAATPTANDEVLLVARDPGATTRWPLWCRPTD